VPEGGNENSANEVKALGAHIIKIDVSHENSVVVGTKNAIEKVGGIDVVIKGIEDTPIILLNNR
jgi:hypothetical protein